MSFFGNNNNNNNNNNNGKRFHNRYIVLVSLGTTATPGTHVPGNSRQSARNAAAEAAQHEQDGQMAAHINQAVLQPGILRCALSQRCLWQQILFLLQSPQQLQIEQVVSPPY